jgi:hypothetical protein
VSHWTQALFEQCGFAVGQSMSPTHCTHPGAFVIPQRGAGPVGPPSPPPLLEASLAVPPELPLEPPLEPPLDASVGEPLEEPLSEDPLEEPEPPSGPVPELLPLQPTPRATAVAIARPRYVFSDDMAGLSCRSERPSELQGSDERRQLGHDEGDPGNLRSKGSAR